MTLKTKDPDSLGGISRLTVLLDNRVLTHRELMRAIELLGTKVAALVRDGLASVAAAPQPA